MSQGIVNTLTSEGSMDLAHYLNEIAICNKFTRAGIQVRSRSQ